MCDIIKYNYSVFDKNSHFANAFISVISGLEEKY